MLLGSNRNIKPVGRYATPDVETTYWWRDREVRDCFFEGLADGFFFYFLLRNIILYGYTCCCGRAREERAFNILNS